MKEKEKKVVKKDEIKSEKIEDVLLKELKYETPFGPSPEELSKIKSKN